MAIDFNELNQNNNGELPELPVSSGQWGVPPEPEPEPAPRPRRVSGGQVELRKRLVAGEQLGATDVMDPKALSNARQTLQKWGIPIISVPNPDGPTNSVRYSVPADNPEHRQHLIQSIVGRRDRKPKAKAIKKAVTRNYVPQAPRLESRGLMLGETMTIIRLELVNAETQRITAAFSAGGEVTFLAPTS